MNLECFITIQNKIIGNKSIDFRCKKSHMRKKNSKNKMWRNKHGTERFKAKLIERTHLRRGSSVQKRKTQRSRTIMKENRKNREKLFHQRWAEGQG